MTHQCPDCCNEFVQPFVCTTCGAQKLYDATVTSLQERNDALAARLAEEIENAATYKQERDEIVVNYETIAAQLTEAHRQNADLMAIIDKRDEALGFIPLDKGMDMMDELREAKARLAEAERDAARYRFIKQWARRLDITGYSLTNNEHFEPRIDEAMQLRPADSAPAVEQKLWLWRNGDHFLAFEHLYPCFTPGGDPMTLGEPVGYAIVKRSFDRAAGSASADATKPGSVWQDISTVPDCDDLLWFCRGDTVDGPRPPASDDCDYWDWWCYAKAPPLPDYETTEPPDSAPAARPQCPHGNGLDRRLHSPCGCVLNADGTISAPVEYTYCEHRERRVGTDCPECSAEGGA